MNKKLTGAILATAVASFLVGGEVKAHEGHGAQTGKVKCSGINACSGKSACHTADNACAGKNACKGKGWLEVGNEKECTDKGGKVVKG